MTQFLIEEALVARLDVVELQEARQRAQDDAVRAAEERVEEHHRRSRDAR